MNIWGGFDIEERKNTAFDDKSLTVHNQTMLVFCSRNEMTRVKNKDFLSLHTFSKTINRNQR